LYRKPVQKMIKITRFTASWCSPCRVLAPIFDQISQEMQEKASFLTIDIDQDKDTTRQYGIRSVPTIVITKDGEEVKRIVGLKSINEYRNIFNSI